MTRLDQIKARLAAYLTVRYHRDELIELNLTPDAYEFFDHVPDDLTYLLQLVEAGEQVIREISHLKFDGLDGTSDKVAFALSGRGAMLLQDALATYAAVWEE